MLNVVNVKQLEFFVNDVVTELANRCEPERYLDTNYLELFFKGYLLDRGINIVTDLIENNVQYNNERGPLLKTGIFGSYFNTQPWYQGHQENAKQNLVDNNIGLVTGIFISFFYGSSPKLIKNEVEHIKQLFATALFNKLKTSTVYNHDYVRYEVMNLYNKLKNMGIDTDTIEQYIKLG